MPRHQQRDPAPGRGPSQRQLRVGELVRHALAAVLQHEQVASQLAKFGPRKARSRFTWNGIAQQLLSSLEGREADSPRAIEAELAAPEPRFSAAREAAEEAAWIA